MQYLDPHSGAPSTLSAGAFDTLPAFLPATHFQLTPISYSYFRAITVMSHQDLSPYLGNIERRQVPAFILHLQSKHKWDNHRMAL